MLYRINRDTWSLRSAPRFDSEKYADPIDMLDHINKLEQIHDEQGNAWCHVEVLRSGQPVRQGFVLDDRLTEIPIAELQWPQHIDRVQFISVLTAAAQIYGTNRDYLALLAQLESDIQNIPATANAGGVGPFRFSVAKWEELVEFDRKLGISTGINGDDIDTPWLQPRMASLLTGQNAEALLGGLGRIPNGLTLYLAHLLGPKAAIVLLKALEQDKNQAVHVALRESLTPQEVQKLMQDPKVSRILSAPTQSIVALTSTIEQKIQEAIDKIAPDIAQFEQNVMGLQGVPGGDPPWLVEARKEIGVKEVPGEGFSHSNRRIEEYHESAGDRAPDDVPWCASFISFCMSKAQNEVVRARNLASKRAADWLEWGEPVANAPVGAVCVTNPIVEGTSGHVGFFIRREGSNVWLLGGNQGNSVCEKAFKLDDVRGFRWLNWSQVSTRTANIRDVQNSSSITEEEMQEILRQVENGSKILGFADKIYASAQKWQVNPIFSLAQSAYETGWWTSAAFVDLNNVGGLSKVDHHYALSGTPGRSEDDGRRWETFNNLADSFNAKMWLLRKHYIGEGKTTIRAIVEKYAPATENNVGQYVIAVEKIMDRMFRLLDTQV